MNNGTACPTLHPWDCDHIWVESSHFMAMWESIGTTSVIPTDARHYRRMICTKCGAEYWQEMTSEEWKEN